MIKFSVVIITLNEESNIKRCLASCVGLTDDIVVLDSGSCDATEEICRQYNCRFFFRKFDDYSSQKNYANSLANYEYILSIDADECLSDKLRQSLFDLDSLSENIAASFNRLNYHCGIPVKHGGWYPDKKMRLWNRNYAKWEGSIHEKIVFAKPPVSIFLNGDLLHYTYSKREDHKRQAAKFARLNAISDYQSGKKASLLKVYISPAIRFFSDFFIKLGILDGKTGFFIAKISAHATFLRYQELFNKNKKKI